MNDRLERSASAVKGGWVDGRSREGLAPPTHPPNKKGHRDGEAPRQGLPDQDPSEH
jgi:hypothetical protein